jgi:pantoate--beta-alanine ligase
MQQVSKMLHREGKVIGFVPTMGSLHKGHSALISSSKKNSDVTVVSVFVNPTQFGPNEDFKKYPRNWQRDKKLLEELEIDYLFAPAVEEIYPGDFLTYVNVEKVTQILEGEFRPTHFKGVTTIVSMLFNTVNPDFAFFGQKDAQQAFIINRMVNDLKFGIKIVVIPIVREKDGLALSSRNVYLSIQERKDALVLNKSLIYAGKSISNKEKKVSKIISGMKKIIESVESSSLDYIGIVDASSFLPVKELLKGEKYFVLIACKIGKTRLIDNILVKA